MGKKAIKNLDKEIKALYRNKVFRYEGLYKYIGNLYEQECYVWYLRSIKVAHKVNKAITGVLTVVMTVLIFYINTAKDIWGISSKNFAVFSSVILLIMVYNILTNIAIKQYVIGVMDDIENDKKLYDVHGMSKYDKLVK